MKNWHPAEKRKTPKVKRLITDGKEPESLPGAESLCAYGIFADKGAIRVLPGEE